MQNKQESEKVSPLEIAMGISIARSPGTYLLWLLFLLPFRLLWLVITHLIQMCQAKTKEVDEHTVIPPLPKTVEKETSAMNTEELSTTTKFTPTIPPKLGKELKAILDGIKPKGGNTTRLLNACLQTEDALEFYRGDVPPQTEEAHPPGIETQFVGYTPATRQLLSKGNKIAEERGELIVRVKHILEVAIQLKYLPEPK